MNDVERFMQAARNNDIVTLVSFLDTGFNADTLDDNGVSAMVYAIANGGMEALECLIKYGHGDVNLRSNCPVMD